MTSIFVSAGTSAAIGLTRAAANAEGVGLGVTAVADGATAAAGPVDAIAGAL